mmetsp:Transcript_32797/g.57098  ORF Transcript_32797/g.57098 Transcript_32797/m.57098 type:complete len:261 (+) Transcript_32797:41-823(+)
MSRGVLSNRDLNRLSASDKNPPTLKSHYRRLSSEIIEFNQQILELDSSVTDKALNSTFSTERPQHRRQQSIIIKEASQTYSFASMLDSLIESPVQEDQREEELILSPLSPVSIDLKKNSQAIGSFGASTMEPKSSIVNSEVKSSLALSEHDKRLSTIYTVSSESVTKPQPLFEKKPAFNYETQVHISGTFCTGSFGITSTKAFCMRCNREVVTRVTVQMAKVPFWKAICCSDPASLNKYQEIIHYCAKCRHLIARITTGH